MNKFENIPTEKEITILLRQIDTFNGYDTVLELWLWDGIQGQSVIFLAKDVKNLTDEELKNMIKEHYKTESETISRMDSDYVFLNFNFVITK